MNHQPKKGKAPQLHLVARAILACLIVLETYTILTTTLQSSSGVDPTTSAPVTTAATAVVQASVTERDTFEQLSRRTGANDAVVPRRARSSNTIIRTKRKTHKLGERPAKIQQLNTVDVVESNNLIVGLSRRHVEPTSNVTAAICFKTLFGNIDLGIVIQWAAYNRLLGFDHIYMFYRPEMTEVPRFEELKSLPYVTLTLNEDGTRVNYYNQWQTEILCLSEQKYAAKYDWALLADIDEYLWFAERIGIKEFLTRPSSQNLTYISFAKRMYTLDHRTDMQTVNHTIDMSSKSSDNFALSKYPFYIDHFCFHKGHRRGDPICPTWRGRSKVIVRPQFHTVMDTHGTIKQPDPANGTIHLSSEQAHFMEWPEIFAKHNVTKRDPVDFFVQTEDQVHIHNLQLAFKADATGNLRMQYDDKLEDWFRFVMGRYSAGP